MRRTAPTAAAAPITVERKADGSYVVNVLTPAGVVSLGQHARVADAWRAIDEIDSPVAFAQAA